MKPLSSNVLRLLRNRISHIVTADSPRQVFLAGPQGRGKTTLIMDIVNHGNHQMSDKALYSYYNMDNNAHHNLQVMVTQFLSSLISQNSLVPESSLKDCANIYEILVHENPAVLAHIRTFCERILTLKHVDRELATYLRNMLDQSDTITPETWVNTCQMLLKHSPATMGIQKDVTVTPAEACFYNLYASGIIAERTELESADASNPSAMLTTRYAIAHVLRANKKLCDLRNRKWILCLDEVHHLYQSCFLHDRGPRFLSDLLLEIQRNKVNSVLVSDDSTVCFPYVDEKLAQSISQCYMKTYKDLGYVDTKQLVHLDIPEIETNVAKGGINEVVYHSDSVSKALLKLSGGNLGLINTLLTSYQKFEEQLDLPAVHKILAGSESPVDDEYFPLNATAEEQVTYLREERSRMFVRNIQNVALSSNISKFENMMNRFLSLPLMEQIKLRLEDYVHFKVTVNETIRLLLSKNILQLKPKANIENKVVLCMLAAGIIHLNVETRCIEFKDTLTRVLLEAHIDNDYASLPWIDQVKYKANYLLNQRKIKKEVDRFLL